MPDIWRDRAYTQIEAATLIGLSPSHLRVWVHRNEDVDVLFSVKKGGRRFFSAMDISVLRIAHELERAGMHMVTAIACAFEHLQSVPARDAILKIKGGTTSFLDGTIISDRDVSRLIVDRSWLLIPIGKLVQEVLNRCDDLIKEPSH